MKAAGTRSVKVLAADDSALMRMVLRILFQKHANDVASSLPPMELLDVVADGEECLQAVARLRPDVLVLDLEMPRLDGLGVLARLRRQQTMLPVILCSAHSEPGARATLDGLSLGARDYVMKPSQQSGLPATLDLLTHQLLPKIAALAGAARVRSNAPIISPSPVARHNDDGPAALALVRNSAIRPRVEMVTIAVSTGGPSALEEMLSMLPAGLSVPVLIVQHMPRLFTTALAERLNKRCALAVREAYHGAVVKPGEIWIAPGDAHMEVAELSGDGDGGATLGPNVIRLHHRPPLHSCMPSADYLFASAASRHGAGVLALVMTGMGSDGLDGARAVYQAGGTILVQDEASSAVWGMPGRVAEAGIANAIVPLALLAEEITSRVAAGHADSRDCAHGLSSMNVPVSANGGRENQYGLL